MGQENLFKFGFIPMSDLEVPSKLVPSVSNAVSLTLYDVIKVSGEYNF